MTSTIDAPQTDAAPGTDPYSRVLDNLDANFGVAPRRRAAHAKGVVTTGFFSPTAEASEVSRAGHLTGARTPVVARFSSFPGGADHPDTAPEANPRGLAVQFRLGNGATTDLLAHSINGFPGRTIEDFADFLAAISPEGSGVGGVPRRASGCCGLRRGHPGARRPEQLRHPELLACQRLPLPGPGRE